MSIRYVRAATVLALALSTASATRAAPLAAQSAPASDPVVVRLDSVLAGACARGDVASLSVAVIRAGEPVFVRACGLANLEDDIAATPASVYEYASMTKSFTGAAVLRLAEQGKVALSDSAARYLPAWRRQLGGITVRQLLDHTSGLPDYASLGDALAGSDYVTLPEADVVRAFLDAPRLFLVGKGWSYTSSGYFLASLLVERLTGEPFETAVRRLVLEPAGLSSVRAVAENEVVPHRARPYRRQADGWKTYDFRLHNVAGAGILEGTALDLARWPRALRAGGLLRAESYRAMTTPEGAARGINPADSTFGYGLGVFVRTVGGRRIVYHPGNSFGHSGTFCDASDADVSAAVLTNTDAWMGTTPLCRQLLAAALGDAVSPLPPVESDSAIVSGRETTAAERAAAVGTYPLRVVRGPGADQTRWTAVRITARVFEQNGRLMLFTPGSSVEELLPQADGSFRAAVSGNVARFERDASGKNVTMVYTMDQLLELRGVAHSDPDPASGRAAVEAAVTEGLFGAVARADTAAMRAAVTPEFELVEDSLRLSLAQFQAMVRSYPATAAIAYRFGDFHTVVRDSVAWTSYRNDATLTIGGAARPLAWLETAVLERRDGRWRVARLQSTSVHP